jgi:adenosylcobinamide-phosphate synthase
VNAAVLGGGVPLVLAAILIEAAIGALPGLRGALNAPAAATAAAAGWFERRLNRARRGTRMLAVRGLVVVIVLAWLAAAAGAVIGGISVGSRWRPALDIAALVFLIGFRPRFAAARAVGRALAHSDLDGARHALAIAGQHDVGAGDQHALARAAIESLTERLAGGIVGIAFWYLLAGLPGAFVFRAVNAVAARIGLPTPHLATFGLVAARLDEALRYVPALIAGLLLCAAALFVPGASAGRGLRTLLRDGRRHPSASAGWTDGAAAGALGLALGGPRRIGGYTLPGPWIGDGRARATARDVQRACWLAGVAWLFALVALALLIVAER